MPRAPNFTFQDPTAEIGNSLVRAIVGDPEMAAKQRQMQAEAALREAQRQEAEAHGGLYRSQTTGQNTANTAQSSLPELYRQWGLANGPAPEQPTVDSAGFGDFDAPFAMPVDNRPDKLTSLGNLIAGMGQMSGDKIDPTKMMGAYGAFTGSDPMERSAIIAQGGTPGKDFAIDAGRADEIAANDMAGKTRLAWGVADRNHATDIPVANIRRASAFDVAGVNHKNDIPVALINNRDNIGVAEIRSGGGGKSRGERNNNPGNLEFGSFAKRFGATSSDGRFAVFPTFEAGKRAQEALLAGPGYLSGGRNTIDAILTRYAPPSDGNSVDNYGDYVSRVTGIPRNQPIGPDQIPAVAEAMRQFETGSTGGRGAKPGKPGKAPPPPKPINKAGLDLIDGELKTYGVNGLDRFDREVPGYDPLDRIAVRADAAAIYQQTGNPAEAARKAVFNLAAKRRAQQGRSRPGDPGYAPPKAKPAAAPATGAWGKATVVSAPPVPGARKAPDGKWYVQTGTNGGKPTYSRVD